MKYLKVIIILLLIIACQGKKETVKTEEKSSLQVPKLDTVVLNNDTINSEKKVDSIKEKILEPPVPSPPPPPLPTVCEFLIPEPIEDTLISDSIEEKILPPSIPSSSSHIIICDFSAVTAIRDSINKAKKDSINQVSKTSIETQE